MNGPVRVTAFPPATVRARLRLRAGAPRRPVGP